MRPGIHHSNTSIRVETTCFVQPRIPVSHLIDVASMINEAMRTAALMPTPWCFGPSKLTGTLDHILGAPTGRLLVGHVDVSGRVGMGSLMLHAACSRRIRRLEGSRVGLSPLNANAVVGGILVLGPIHALVHRQRRDRVNVHAAPEDAHGPGNGQQEDGRARQRAHAHAQLLLRVGPHPREEDDGAVCLILGCVIIWVRI